MTTPATETTPRYFLFEVRDSDGNDCTVIDVIVAAETRDKASDALWEHLGEMYPNDESDGGFGTYHACDCQCDHASADEPICEACHDTWECSHGGLITNEDSDGPYGVQEFSTYAEARNARATYHSLIDLT